MEKCNLCCEFLDSDELIQVEDGLVKMKDGFVSLSAVISDVLLPRVCI